MKKIKPLSDIGANELRCAIIKQALDDVEDFILSKEFVTDKVIDGLSEKWQEQAHFMRNQTRYHAEDAQKFLGGKWCQILAGNLNVPLLIDQVQKNADDKIELLSTPTKLYRGTRKHHQYLHTYDSLYGMQLSIIQERVIPSYFLNRIKEDKATKEKYIEFDWKGVSYYAEIGWK